MFNLPSFAIKRPAFITSLMALIITIGVISFNKMSIDLFPKIDIPTIFISTTYSGAGPTQIETAITKPMEEEISTIAGIKKLTSRSLQDTSQLIITFSQNTDMRYAEQQVRDKINQVKPKLPDDVKESIIRKIDPSDEPILTVSFSGNLNEGKLYDFAENYIKPRLEQVNNVGLVEIVGGRKREIQILLDQNILRNRDISYSKVMSEMLSSGQNVPIGKSNINGKETVFSSDSEFNDLDKINNTLVNFYSNEVATKISNLAKVEDSFEEENSRAFFNGKPALFLDIYRQSDSNIIAVSEGLRQQIKKMENDFSKMDFKPEVQIVEDASHYIKTNVLDVYETIFIAVILTVITVFFFLANWRATLITAVSLPIALVSSFILMSLANFSINVISLLAMSLAVGLLVDDAIVVVENIYRQIESGKTVKEAAVKGTTEILMAVVAITLVVVAVFTPVSFMGGIIGQYLKQFGLTIAFSMLVSLFVAVTIIPVLCAYFASQTKKHKVKNQHNLLAKFDNFQIWLENKYEKILVYSVSNPKKIIIITFLIFGLSIFTSIFVPKTFIDESDNGEVIISVELDPNANLDATNKTLDDIFKTISQNPEIQLTTTTVGSNSSQSNRGGIYIKMKSKRKTTTTDFKEKLRNQLKEFAYANPIVKDYNPSGGGSRSQPFNMSLISNDSKLLEAYSEKLLAKIKENPNFKDVSSSNKETRDEIKIVLKPNAEKVYGVNDKMLGEELRGYIEGYVVGKLRQNGYEYDIRAKLKEGQRDLQTNFNNFYISNINSKLIKLSDIASLEKRKEPARIDRQDRGRNIQINASLAPKAGLSAAIEDVETLFKSSGDLKLPTEIRYRFSGDSEDMQEMLSSMGFALFISVLFIYLILASLYESFVTPLTILLALPFAICGVFFGLFITGNSINIFTILGIFMLVAVACKNSILLIDFTNHLIDQGKTRSEAMIIAGKARLRPILMTSFALIAGTLPVAIGLSEISKQRTGMGVAIISGLISSTILTLVVVPAVFNYIDNFRIWCKSKASKIIN